MRLVTFDTRGGFSPTPNRAAILGPDGQSRQALKRMLGRSSGTVSERPRRSWTRTIGERIRQVGDTPRQEQLDLTTGSTQAGSTQADTLPRAVSEPVQGGLFPDDSVPDELVGYRGPSACQIAGITYRCLLYTSPSPRDS